MSRTGRILSIVAVLAVVAIVAADVLPGASAIARRAPGAPAPPPRATAPDDTRSARAEAGDEARGGAARAIEIARVVVAELRPPPEREPGSEPVANASWIVEHATYTFRASADEAVFVLVGIRETAVRAGTHPERALADANVAAERQTTQAVVHWAAANGANAVRRDAVRAAVAELTTAVYEARSGAGDPTYIPCPDGSKASCRSSDLLAGLLPRR